ncbi:hypothetical protein FQN52_004993 [Onygenales sp. PD_12]|nr:hypothetical protein FQN52_004993 [Onygenales sp. PD_12]
MSLDPGGLTRSASPASSEASQPKSRAAASDAAEVYKKDKNYRRYASSVERALSLFDTALQEWADYISFLSKLLKALQSHPPSLPIVPNKTVVARRLAQCLNPSLPSGVHQKALEVYGYIFSMLKPDGVSRDLALYLPGIAATLSFASLTVRPLFLSLVETYIVDLDPSALRPALKAVILALLPGLEEETSEDFEAALRIVNKLRNITLKENDPLSGSSVDAGSQYFWQCLFLSSITNPSRRPGVLAYLNRYLPKLGGTNPWLIDENEGENDVVSSISAVADSVIMPEPGLLIRCFATGLADEQYLVQRNYLDLLVTHLPLHSPVLQRSITADDLGILVAAAAGVVTRRDMSLNRRLWSWFLGPDTANGAHEAGDIESPLNAGNAASLAFDHESSKSQYFGRFGLKPLVRSIKNMIDRNSLHPPERAKPFRISLSLMDRWEVGGLVVPAVFLPVMHSVQQYKSLARSTSHFDEVFRSANAFFDGVESSLIFSELLSLIHVEPSGIRTRSNRALEDLKLANFIVSHFNMREEEMLVIHIPMLLLALLAKMKAISSNTEIELDHQNVKSSALDEIAVIIKHLLELVPDRAFHDVTVADAPKPEKPSKAQLNITEELISRKIIDFYKQSKESLELPGLPFAPQEVGELVLREAHSLVLCALESEDQSELKDRVNLFISLLNKTPKSKVVQDGGLFSAMYRKLTSKPYSVSLPFATISSICSVVTTLYSIHNPGFYISYGRLCDIVPFLIQKLWGFLSPLSPKFHVETVRCLWLLHSATWQDHLVEASITSLMIGSDKPNSAHLTTLHEAEKFFVLWNHSHQINVDISTIRTLSEHPLNSGGLRDPRSLYQSSMLDRPLFIVLDLLSGTINEASLMVKEWIHDLSSVHRIFRIITSRLMELSYLASSDRQTATEQEQSEPGSANQCRYLFETVSHIIASLSPVGWSSIISNTVSELGKQREPAEADDDSDNLSIQSALIHICIRALTGRVTAARELHSEEERMQLAVFTVMRQLLMGPGAEQLVELDMDGFLIDQLCFSLDNNRATLQPAMIDTLLAALKNRFTHELLEAPQIPPKHHRKSSIDALSNMSRLSLGGEKPEQVLHVAPLPPPQLLQCLLKGLSSTSSHGVVQKWINLLGECLPLYSRTIFQVLLTLVECLCKQITASYNELQLVFKKTHGSVQDRSEHITIALLSGLENCIATAHERLLVEEESVITVKSPDQPQGFFGNMVSGVFATEGNQTRSATANDRLTVLLCFQDTVRLCFSIWSWGSIRRHGNIQDPESISSFQYTSLRMRNRSRRILEHLFDAEALDCLETLVQLWHKAVSEDDPAEARSVFNLLHTLDGSRPKVTIPAIFNSIYSRTNPAALEPSRKSVMTSRLSEADLVAFLVTYARSLDDDVLDEIWADCTTFLRDVLANPFPHRQILPRLMEFTAILGEKMERTNFGDDRRARKDLGDLLLRLLTAIFTSKPLGSQEPTPARQQFSENERSGSTPKAQQLVGPDDIVSILASVMPALVTTLGETDRISTAMSNISTNIVAPLFHSRLFPQNVHKGLLELVYQMSKIPAASKHWRKDVSDAFNDPKFFTTKLGVVQSNWLNLLRHWVLTDKDRLPDLLSRLTPPTSAGIMFGVGATAARLEADRKAQLNLRRIALLVLAANEDHFSGELSNVHQKLEDLLTATHISSPSSVTRAEIYMVLRSLVLKTSAIHLSPFWPMINSELHDAISAIAPGQHSETYSPYSLLQACKLLETLLLIAPDDFQLQEWLFVTDTIDVIYPPDHWQSIALADGVAQSLGTESANHSDSHSSQNQGPNDHGDGFKKSWLNSELSRETAKDEIVDTVLRPFFDRLSIHAFESMYSMGVPDLAACKDDLLADLFNEFTVAN